MEVYLVGGAVRDELLGLPVMENDWVVVGATEEELLNQGYTRVGTEFPVFLHPETREEYALARTERKTGPGHTGFETHSDPNVTLEEDLQRRDLTINAIARSSDGTYIDPCGGRLDLENKCLRHVSDAFAEDPLRIIRVARFLAKLHHLGFSVHPSTTEMLRKMVTGGMHRELTPERVLLELDKALVTDSPAVFFHYLAELEADGELWPEITAAAVSRMEALGTSDPEARFAALALDLPPEGISALCTRLRTPGLRSEVTELASALIETWEEVNSLGAEEQADLIAATDGLRKLERFQRFNKICELLSTQSHASDWQRIRDTMASVKAADLAVEGLSGPELGEAIRVEQIRRLGNLS